MPSDQKWVRCAYLSFNNIEIYTYILTSYFNNRANIRSEDLTVKTTHQTNIDPMGIEPTLLPFI
jgi:hypothetical protein